MIYWQIMDIILAEFITLPCRLRLSCKPFFIGVALLKSVDYLNKGVLAQTF